jgi:hypothetical protein
VAVAVHETVAFRAETRITPVPASPSAPGHETTSLAAGAGAARVEVREAGVRVASDDAAGAPGRLGAGDLPADAEGAGVDGGASVG